MHVFDSLPPNSALVNEIDLAPQLVPILPIEVDVLKEVSPFCKVVHVKVNLWWPVSARDIVRTQTTTIFSTNTKTIN
jgi:hypothetical protein